MLRLSLRLAPVFVLCLAVSFTQAAQRGKGAGESKEAERGKAGEKPTGGKPPGGAWSENKSAAKKNEGTHTGAEGAAAEHAAGNKNPQATGKEGAAAGAAAARRREPTNAGEKGAAAGAAAAKRNEPAASGAEGAAVGAAAAKRNQPAVSGAAGAAAGYAGVRNSFDHPNLYNEQWYAEHNRAWNAAKWSTGTAWALTGFAAATNHLGYGNVTPISYGYGSNVTYQNGNVLLDGNVVGTGEEFSQQAADLALLGQNANASDGDDWLPLGVFALVRNEDHQPQSTVQLAVNPHGILRGNYTDLVTDHALPIEGAVDKKSLRAAWTVGENKNYFMEAGMKNLTDGEATALIHKNGKTELWHLVRLTQPGQEENAPPEPNEGK